MAIQKKKIPSPSEVKTSTHSFNEEELKELRELKENLASLTVQMGQLFINKIKIEEAELRFKKEFKVLEDKESNIAKKLSDKYGNGSIDLNSGTFTPTK